MPVAAQSLLQTPAASAPKAAVGNPVQPARAEVQPFAKVYAKASDPLPAVADSGNPLPGGKVKDTASTDQDDSASKSGDDAAVTDLPVLQPVMPQPAPLVEAVPEAVPVTPEVQVAQLAAQAPPQSVVADGFDPEADPLDDMPAVRLAMEQGGHVSASSQAPAKTSDASTQEQPTASQSFAAGMAVMVDQQASKNSADPGGDKAFGSLIEGGLKGLKEASSDTRVDDFANRLAALTQAATPKTANALPPVANAPLAMHQSGWTDEIVNRVMYLSSGNLKSAEIQLQPAELGRLDIKVHMTADQQAQVNFMSAHPVVREALESQSGRLREMFAQQGMGQVDVNVSDQSRGQEQQQQQQVQTRGVSGGGGRSDGSDSGGHIDVADTVAPVASTVIGSSAVDYYA